MRLRSLDIKGFKSFADRTIINFSEDVIGIVGSNGCGKSNIVDAIRWVLGEQKTKQLRSETMTSVIFNGTKSRKASAMAEVTLVFDNDKGILPMEYQQVSIKRTLFKDGSSAYYLNGIKCRLKDISNLLADTGMGSDSYAIIALGMVDELLQDKENARLKLFEQAAGVSKYKVRKKETLSKLKSTSADLERVEDLVFEIEKNLKTLERQAKRAKLYFELKEEYKKFSLEWSYFKIAAYKSSYKQLDKQIKEEFENKNTLEKELVFLEKKVEKNKEGSVQKEEHLTVCQRKLSGLISRIRTKENDQKMLLQKTLFLEQNKDKLELRISGNKEKLLAIENKIDVYSDQLDAAFDAGKILSADLAAAKEKLTKIRQLHGATKSQLEDFVKEQQRLNISLFQQEKELAILENQQQTAQNNIGRIQNNIGARALEIKTIKLEASELKELQKEEENTIDSLQKKEVDRKEKLEETTENIEQLQEKLSGENRRLDAKKNEHKLLKSLVENMEGFSESIKFLSKNKSWSNNAPLLSDIFYCEPKYRAAIENYLEEYLGYYVVQNFAEALTAIALLEEHKKGKANFFLLEQFDSLAASPKASKGVCALDILEYDSPYKALAEHLLGAVYVVPKRVEKEDLDPAVIWLTEDGKFIQKNYSIKGGYVGAFEGKKIGRKKNLQLLEQQIEVLQQQTNQLQEALKDLRVLQQHLRQANYQKEINRLQQQCNQTIRKVIGIQSKIENFEQFEKENLALITSYQKQIENQSERTKNTKLAWAGVQQKIKELQANVSDKDASVQQITEAMSAAAAEYNQKHIEQVKQQNLLANIEKELDFSHQQYKELKDQCRLDEKLQIESGGHLAKTQKEIEALGKILEEWSELKGEYQAQQTLAEKEYFELRGESNQTEKDWREGQRKYNQLVELVGVLENKFNEIKLKLTTIAERLNVEFEININDLINKEPNRDYEEKELEIKVEKLRKRLQNYGSINPMAIEAYDEIQKRYQTIVEQRKDLLEAKENLLATIAEIETKATEQFMVAFKQVRLYFIEVFRSLFLEDDTCDLVLTNPSQPLDSRIEIIAKPKGKRPLSINQLSGGEKTLTATALLFALYLLKPAPFCVFDEVDAPLDDANIAKFNQIVKNFSKNSQFIIVTHNKKTMESVDIMYGVTMVQGISRVVPVDFRELNAARLS